MMTKTNDLFLSNVEHMLENSHHLLAGLRAVRSESIAPTMAAKVQRFIQTLERQPTASEFLNSDENLEWLPVLVSSREQEPKHERWRALLKLVESDRPNETTWRQFIYPTLVLFAALFVLILCQIYLVAPFGHLFRAFGLVLPPPTRLLVSVTDIVVQYPLQVTLSMLFAAFALVMIIRWWRSVALTTRMFGLLIAGNSSGLRAMSQFVRLVADALSLNATLPQALRIAGRGCGHYHFNDMADRLASFCDQQGQRVDDTPVSHNFPATLLVALSSEAAADAKIDQLRSLAQMMSDRVQQRSPVASGVWGPVALGFVGLFIAFVILSVFAPLVSMITSLT